MNREDIIRMADKSHLDVYGLGTNYEKFANALERFAALVAKHTLANIDPSSFMSWQEGYEAGKQTEREAWEHRYARLQSLMDVRETQPNKPCCLAEREACAKLCEEEYDTGLMMAPVAPSLATKIRARGQA